MDKEKIKQFLQDLNAGNAKAAKVALKDIVTTKIADKQQAATDAVVLTTPPIAEPVEIPEN